MDCQQDASAAARSCCGWYAGGLYYAIRGIAYTLNFEPSTVSNDSYGYGFLRLVLVRDVQGDQIMPCGGLLRSQVYGQLPSPQPLPRHCVVVLPSPGAGGGDADWSGDI
jgi:hypothetical protein